MRLHDLLSKGSLLKSASIEMQDKATYEQDFSKLAYGFVTDRATKLVPHLIGFEVVESNDDGSRAVGIFGFKVSDKFYYVPAFFINNQIKGIDLLYSKDDDTFMPLQEQYIDKILSYQSVALGETERVSHVTAPKAPDFSFVSEVPGSARPGAIGKIASVNGFNLPQNWDLIKESATRSLYHDPEFQSMLAGAISSRDINVAEKSASDVIPSYLSNFGGPSATSTLINTFGNYEFLKAAYTFYENPIDLLTNTYKPELLPKEAASDITVCDADSPGLSDCSEEEKSKVITNGFVIKDTRGENVKATVVEGSFDDMIQAPFETGKYAIILTNGDVKDCDVIIDGSITLVQDTDSSYVVPTGNVYAIGCRKPGDIDVKGVKLHSYMDDNHWNTNIVFINPKDNSILGPFSLSYRYADKAGETKMYDMETNRDTLTRLTGIEELPYDSFCDHKAKPKYLTHDSSIPKPKQLGDTLYIPKTYIAVPVCDRSLQRFASSIQATATLIENNMSTVSAKSDDGGISYSVILDGKVDKDKTTYKQACIHLVTAYNMGVPDAERLLSKAGHNYKASVIVKQANGVQMEIPQTQMPGFDQQVGVPIVRPQVDITQGQTTGITPPRPTGAGTGINRPTEGDILPDEERAIAEQAAAVGQKTVFNHATVGGLARIYDVDAAIDSFIPEFMRTLDRLGRVIFLFYWKNDEFAERYGLQDLPDIEDQIRSVFKSYGTLVYRLSNKAVNNSADYMN